MDEVRSRDEQDHARQARDQRASARTQEEHSGEPLVGRNRFGSAEGGSENARDSQAQLGEVGKGPLSHGVERDCSSREEGPDHDRIGVQSQAFSGLPEHAVDPVVEDVPHLRAPRQP